MAISATPEQVVARRQPAVVVLISVLFFLGITALGGGMAMVFGLGGGEVAIPSEWLEGIPLVQSWLVPGLVLGIGFGIGSLMTGVGMMRRMRWGRLAFLERWTGCHWSWAVAMIIGFAHMVWIGLELAYLPELSWLQPLYGAVAVALFTLPWLPSVRRALATGEGAA
jgi:hypothetical protein